MKPEVKDHFSRPVLLEQSWAYKSPRDLSVLMQDVRDGTGESVVLPREQAIPMLLAHRPHFEKKVPGNVKARILVCYSLHYHVCLPQKRCLID